jgi:hypothetical protein
MYVIVCFYIVNSPLLASSKESLANGTNARIECMRLNGRVHFVERIQESLDIEFVNIVKESFDCIFIPNIVKHHKPDI